MVKDGEMLRPSKRPRLPDLNDDEATGPSLSLALNSEVNHPTNDEQTCNATAVMVEDGEMINLICNNSNVLANANTDIRELSEALPAGQDADTPPRGWNSYDSFSWIISEEDFLRNAEIISHSLLAHGYKYVVVDFLWYRRNVDGSSVDSAGYDVIDEWGRVIPDPDRWPSSKGGKGFSEVAKKVHAMGLKFGIHVMRGISTQAVNANTPILDVTKGGPYEESGKQFNAHDIGRGDRACSWMSQCFTLVDTNSGAGKAFLRSLYHQYAAWGVDFVKHDCIFGDDLDVDEIRTVSEILRELDRPIVYSISPGTHATPAMAKNVNNFVNMYRITADDWDKWEDVAGHFSVSRCQRRAT
ncbi:alpha-galactosidase mel1-like [Macadamia integrifolia]|uniref:alpha-galactosidase mel1-like n=1 Tax=Macadamia integrifolia TaxID=60698 RepID=UPI001C500E4E|nr:alpha-galactosidase mel1-like [Macadamia integrifolia]